MKRDGVIQQCTEKDRVSDRSVTDQKWCLFTKDGDKLLGRHPTREDAVQQEKAIHARGGATKMSKYIRLAEVPESAVKSLYDQKWGQGIMKALGQDFDVDAKSAQFLFHSVWSAVISLMDKVLQKTWKIDTTAFAQDPTFMQSLAGLAYFVADDAIKKSVGLKSDSLGKGAGHAEALMAVIDKEAPVDQTLEGLAQQAAPIADKAFEQLTSWLAQREPEQKAASVGRDKAAVLVSFLRGAAFHGRSIDPETQRIREEFETENRLQWERHEEEQKARHRTEGWEFVRDELPTLSPAAIEALSHPDPLDYLDSDISDATDALHRELRDRGYLIYTSEDMWHLTQKGQIANAMLMHSQSALWTAGRKGTIQKAAFLRGAAFGEEDEDDWAEQPRGYILRYTYGIVTPESAQDGDYAEHGFVQNGQNIPLDHDDMPADDDIDMLYGSLAELVNDLEYDHNWIEWSGLPASPGDWITSEEDEDYATGEHTTYNAHITHEDGSDLTPQEMQYIHDRLRLYGEVEQSQRELPLAEAAVTEAGKLSDKQLEMRRRKRKSEDMSQRDRDGKQRPEPDPETKDLELEDAHDISRVHVKDAAVTRVAITPKYADRLVREWARTFDPGATGHRSIWLYPVVQMNEPVEGWLDRAEHEGLYIPAGQRDRPGIRELLQQQMNDQLAQGLNQDTEAGQFGNFVYIEQGGQWGLMYETPAIEDLLRRDSKPQPAVANTVIIQQPETPQPMPIYKHQGGRYRAATAEEIKKLACPADGPLQDGKGPHRDRDSRAPAMQLTQQLGKQPKGTGERTTEKPKADGKVKKFFEWLGKKAKEASVRTAEVLEQGYYITLEELPDGDLKLIATPEFQKDFGNFDLNEGEWDYYSVMGNLLEDIQADGSWSWVDPATIGALTDAPIITDYMDYSDEAFGQYDEAVPHAEARVWWYPNYMVHDFIEDLAQTGETVFTLSPEDRDRREPKRLTSDPRQEQLPLEASTRQHWGRLAGTTSHGTRRACGCSRAKDGFGGRPRDSAAAVQLPAKCVADMLGVAQFSKNQTVSFEKQGDTWFVDGQDSKGVIGDDLVGALQSYCEQQKTAAVLRTALSEDEVIDWMDGELNAHREDYFDATGEPLYNKLADGAAAYYGVDQPSSGLTGWTISELDDIARYVLDEFAVADNMVQPMLPRNNANTKPRKTTMTKLYQHQGSLYREAQPYFRSDNTEGYSDEELAKLNAEFSKRAGDETDESRLDNIAEKVLMEYDTGKLKLGRLQRTALEGEQTTMGPEVSNEFRGFDFNRIPEVVEKALADIKAAPEDYQTEESDQYEVWTGGILSPLSGNPEDYAAVLDIDTDDPAWQEAVAGGWDWDYLQDVEDEVNEKIGEYMERNNLLGYLVLMHHEWGDSYGLMYGISGEELEAMGVELPPQPARGY